MKKETKYCGFTLIEFIIVVAIIVVLSSLVVISFNPAEQMKKARDKQRETHVNAIYLALMEYKSREGEFPACVTSTPADVYGCLADLVPDHIAELPEDPKSDCPHQTGYFAKKDSVTGIAGVRAECYEGEDEIEVGSW